MNRLFIQLSLTNSESIFFLSLIKKWIRYENSYLELRVGIVVGWLGQRAGAADFVGHTDWGGHSVDSFVRQRHHPPFLYCV
jgi:hypothetical protein